MCNNYGLKHPLTVINQAFSDIQRPLVFSIGAPNLAMRDDIRPTETAPVVRAGEGGTELVQLRWGFAAPAPKRPPVINFRSEGRRFENGAQAARCLIPASHFYEFTAPPEGAAKRALKSKWEFTWRGEAVDGLSPLFCIAGWMRVDSRAEGGAAFTMLTCEPGPDVATLHDRQVVVLGPADWAAWLDGNAEAAGALLRPAPAGTLAVRQVR